MATLTSKFQPYVKQAIADKIADEHMTAIGIMDLTGLRNSCGELIEAFGPTFQHTFAVKANPLLKVLEELKECGVGAEVASPGELELSLGAGFDVSRIIFDSPAKTWTDLRACIEQGIAINIDNLQELDRVDQLMQKYPDSKSIIGFRVNPQIGAGDISSTSTATMTSKFGFPLADGDNKQQLVEIYGARPWLTSIHTHSGSQGCPLPLMVQGARAVTDLANEINGSVGFRQIERIDIGGGLPVNFASDEISPTFEEYVTLLREGVPELFSGEYLVKTEFGRAIAAKNGFILTRVEYTKNSGGRHIATTHAGAQIATRTAFLPEAWPIRAIPFSSDGNLKVEDVVKTDVAGPCCFASDLITRNADIAMLQANDYVVVPDTGAYYFSNHFDYNSLPRIAVYAAKSNNEMIELQLIRGADSVADVVARMS